MNNFNKLTFFLKNRTAFLLFLTVLTIFSLSLLSPYFLTWYNITQILHFMTVIFLISIGQNLVILAGGAGIDLSVGSVISLSGVLLAKFYQLGIPILWDLLIVVILGCIMGGFNSLIIVKIKIPPLIATIGTLYLYDGISLVLAENGTISGFPDNFSYIGQGIIANIPVKIIFLVIPIFLFLFFLMKKKEFGRNIYFIGINDLAAKYAGINVDRFRMMLYILSSLLATVGGILMSSYLMVAKADVGRDFELQSVVIVMLAGTSILGGVGKLENIIPATLIITMLATGLQLAQINYVWQMGILGFLLLVIMIVNNIFDQIGTCKNERSF